MKQVERIKYYEAIFDEALEKVEAIDKALLELDDILAKVQELEDYYNSETYRQDYKDDEDGKIDKDLKRGILSEDGIYNLLSDLDKYRELL